jgi:protein-S-isoprenylcysteine O-methyltransferase Ste14
VWQSWYAWLVAGLWLAWLAYWIIAARNVKATRRHETRLSRVIHLVPMLSGAVLLSVHNLPVPWLNQPFLTQTRLTYWTGVTILAFGLAIAVWARMHLGRNWSGTVTQKQDHELIRSGPYRLVRHPIYSGLLLAIFGTAISLGQWRGLIAFALIAVSLLLRLKTEERFMVEIFGDEYSRYRSEVPALIPHIGRVS